MHYASQPLWPPRCTLAAAYATHFHPSQLECSVTWHRTSKQREWFEYPGKCRKGVLSRGTSVKVKTIPQVLEQPDQRHPPRSVEMYGANIVGRGATFFFLSALLCAQQCAVLETLSSCRVSGWDGWLRCTMWNILSLSRVSQLCCGARAHMLDGERTVTSVEYHLDNENRIRHMHTQTEQSGHVSNGSKLVGLRRHMNLFVVGKIALVNGI